MDPPSNHMSLGVGHNEPRFSAKPSPSLSHDLLRSNGPRCEWALGRLGRDSWCCNADVNATGGLEIFRKIHSFSKACKDIARCFILHTCGKGTENK